MVEICTIYIWHLNGLRVHESIVKPFRFQNMIFALGAVVLHIFT